MEIKILSSFDAIRKNVIRSINKSICYEKTAYVVRRSFHDVDPEVFRMPRIHSHPLLDAFEEKRVSTEYFNALTPEDREITNEKNE